VATTKKVINFFEEKVHLKENPGYAYVNCSQQYATATSTACEDDNPASARTEAFSC